MGWVLVGLLLVLGSSTALLPDSQNFRFAILGDRTGSANAQVYESIWAEIDREHPDFVINVGDTIEGNNDATAAAEWAALQSLFHRYGRYPLYFTPGNHDIWSPASAAIYAQATKRPPFYSFDWKNAHFTVLDNSRTAYLDPRQMSFLEDDLKKSGNKPLHFVFFHRPDWLLPLKFGSGAFELHRLARRYGINYVISGHGHQLVRLERDGVVYLEAGSSGASLQRGLSSGQGGQQGWLYGHLIAEVQDTKVRLLEKELGKPAETKFGAN